MGRSVHIFIFKLRSHSTPLRACYNEYGHIPDMVDVAGDAMSVFELLCLCPNDKYT